MDTVHRLAARGAMPSLEPAHEYPPSAYGASVYFQPALVLETARRAWGARRFDDAMKRYATRWAFAHPTPDALFETFELTHGRAFVDSFLRPALRDGARAGYALGRTTTWPITTARDTWQSEIDVRRTGPLRVPTVLALRYADGREERVRVDPNRVWTRVVVSGRSALVAAEVDPDARVVMDPTRIDNARRTSETSGGTSSLALRLVALAQVILGAIGP